MCLVASASGLSSARAQADTTIIYVRSAGGPRVGVLLEEVTLGSGSHADEYQFSDAYVFIGSGGGVYVVDLRDPRGLSSAVRQYDRAGRLLRTLGRPGRGPGEYFGAPGDVKELPDGRVLLSDGGGIHVYSRSGEPLARWEAKARAINRGSHILVDPSGFVYAYGENRQGERSPVGIAPAPVLYRFRFDGVLVDTIDAPRAPGPNPGRMGRVNIPFFPTFLVAWSPLGYFVTSYTATYAVDIRQSRPDRAGRNSGAMWQPGDPVIRLTRSVASIRVLDAERDDWRQSLTMFMRSGGRSNLNWRWNGPDVPSVKPPISDLFVASDGRIWVRLSQPAKLVSSVIIPSRPATANESYRIDARHRWVEPLLYDVYEPSGRLVGQVRFPDGVARLAVAGDTVWAVLKDIDDVPTVKRFRIDWGPER
jgi:hypothetical protein